MTRSQRRAGGSAELPCHQVGDPSTEVFRGLRRLRLREHADERLGAGRPDENAAGAVELSVDLLDRRQ